MNEPSEDDWEGHWFNPVAFAQRWYDEVWPERDPQEFGSFLASLLKKGENDE